MPRDHNGLLFLGSALLFATTSIRGLAQGLDRDAWCRASSAEPLMRRGGERWRPIDHWRRLSVPVPREVRSVSRLRSCPCVLASARRYRRRSESIDSVAADRAKWVSYYRHE
jgi:hypothetical protein